MAEAFGRSVRAMRGREGVVDVDVAELGERRDKRRIVLFFFLVEARVLQTKNVAVLHRGDGFFGDVADAVVGKADRPAENMREFMRDGFERVFRIAAFRASEMREQDHLAALAGDFGDGRRDALEPRRVGDLAVFHRHVEIDAHENALSLHIGLIESAETASHCLGRIDAYRGVHPVLVSALGSRLTFEP